MKNQITIANAIAYDKSLLNKKSMTEFAIHVTNDKVKHIVVFQDVSKAQAFKDELDCMVDDVVSHVVTDTATDSTAHSLSTRISQINVNPLPYANVIVTTEKQLHAWMSSSTIGYMKDWSLSLYGTMHLFSMELFNFHKQDIAKEFLKAITVSPSSMNNMKKLNLSSQGANTSLLKPSKRKRFVECLTSSAMEVLITKGDYEKIVKVAAGTYSKTTAKVSTLAFYTPELLSRFGSITIRSPFFDKSVMYAILEQQGMVLRETRAGGNVNSVHQNGSRLSLSYFTNGVNSINFKSTSTDVEGKDYEDHIVDHATEDFGSYSFLYCANDVSSTKSVYTKYHSTTSNPEEGHGVPVAHGAHVEGTYHRAIYTYSSIPYESEMSVLMAFGVTEQVIKYDYGFLPAYEFIAETSMGDDEATQDVHLYLIDEWLASQVRAVWPGSTANIVAIANVVPGKKSLSQVPKSYNHYKTYQRVNKSFKEGKREFLKKTATRYIEYCEAGGDQLTNQNPTYTYLKAKYS